MANYQQQYGAAMQGAQQQGSDAEAEYLRRAMGFDPQASMRESAQGQYNSMRELLNRDMGDLRGSQVGTGRIRTGFANQDEDRLVSGAYDRLNNSIMQNSMAGAQMQMQNTAQLGQYGQQRTGQYYDMLSGGMDREQAQKNAAQEKKRSRWATLGSIVGGVGGGIFGGPAGAAAGAQIGGGLGNFF